MKSDDGIKFGWVLFRTLLTLTPVVFLFVAWLRGDFDTLKMLAVFTVASTGWFWLRRKNDRSVTLHGVIACLLVYQTALLRQTND